MKHSRNGVRLAASSLLALLLVTELGHAGDMYVTSDAVDIVRRYDPATGAYVSDFTPSIFSSEQLCVHFGATNNRVLIGHRLGGVEEFDAISGAYIKTYNATGGRQWAGIYGPSGHVLIGDDSTNDVRKYDAATGAFVGVLTACFSPADMRIGPNGNLYVCSFLGGGVLEVNPTTGAFVSAWSLPSGSQANDIAFNPVNGEILVTAMGPNVVFRYSASHALLGSFAGTGWMRPHGIEFSPVSGNLLVIDGVTTQVHEFDPATYAELNPAFIVPTPGAKIVDLAFRADQTVVIHCTPTVNSLGCTPQISGSGQPSGTTGVGFTLSTINVVNNKPGLYIYGNTGRASVPFSGGTLCLNPPIRRSIALNSSGTPPPNNCSGVYRIDMNAFAVGA